MTSSNKFRWLGRTAALTVALAAIAAGATGAASAQAAPNLVGTWKGEAHAVTLGTNPYRKTSGKSANFTTETHAFTFVIKEQRDNRFSGQISSGKRTEQLIGAISVDNKTGIVLDDDGTYLITIRDADTIDACYSHSNPKSKAVGCYAWKRAK